MLSRSSAALFRLSEVTLPGDRRPRLSHLSVEIGGGVTAIVGCSGAGKTSLLNLLAGFERPRQGTIEAFIEPLPADDGRTAQEKPAAEAIKKADDRLPLFWAPAGGGFWPHLTVEQHLTTVADVRNRRRNLKSPDEILNRLHLDHRKAALPADLSQGERSRLAVARALMADAAVLLLDEPLVHVEDAHEGLYWSLIREVVGESGASLVFSSHQPEVVVREAEDVICLEAGRLIYQGSADSLYFDPPDRVCGEFLGRLNWLEPGQAAIWIPDYEAAGQAGKTCKLRPEQVELVQDGKSDLEVVTSAFLGSVCETQLRNGLHDLHLTLFHRSGRWRPAAGDRVRIVWS